LASDLEKKNASYKSIEVVFLGRVAYWISKQSA